MLTVDLDWQKLEYYLDDFIFIILASSVMVEKLYQHNSRYKHLIDSLSIPYQNTKNCISIILSVFRIKIDTSLFVARIPSEKQQKAKVAIKIHFAKNLPLTIKPSYLLISYHFTYKWSILVRYICANFGILWHLIYMVVLDLPNTVFHLKFTLSWNNRTNFSQPITKFNSLTQKPKKLFNYIQMYFFIV